MASTYNLRRTERKDYKMLTEGTVRIPRCSRVSVDKLYPITVLEKDGGRVKIHYDGYGEEYDEWRNEGDIVLPTKPEIYKPFELYRELAYQIKLALDSKGRHDPQVRIEIPFDKLLFEGGLKQAGIFLHTSRGYDVYSIKQYTDLTPFLGSNWHIRGINERMNFCYAELSSVLFYLYKRKPLLDFTVEGKQEIDAGHLLVFKFVRMDGVQENLHELCS